MMPHTYADERIARWLEKNGYHPRSDKHGKALCDYFLDDLLYECEPLRKASKSGEVVYDTDYTVGEGTALKWTIDLVIGTPVSKPLLAQERGIARGVPNEILLAIDAKSVMTEHGKARRNRQRDINSLWQIMKHHYPNSVTGGILLVNIADTFKSPLRDKDDITTHRNVARLVEGTIQLFREVDRSKPEGNGGIEAIGVIVVDHTNLPNNQTRFVTDSPAPREGDIVHYRKFIRLIAEALELRYFR